MMSLHLSYCLRIKFYAVLFVLVLFSACRVGGADREEVYTEPTGDQGHFNPKTGAITPVVITTPYRGSVTEGGASYYVVKGLIEPTRYTISAFAATGEISLSGNTSSAYLGSSCLSRRSGASLQACSMSSTTSGDIYIKISGENAGSNANFTLDIFKATASQGLLSSPLEITTSSLPYHGMVIESKNSYYVISGLNKEKIYTISLTNNINNPQLTVYTSKNFSNAVESYCYSSNASWENESCELSPILDGKLYVKVYGGSSFPSYGAYFVLNVRVEGQIKKFFKIT